MNPIVKCPTHGIICHVWTSPVLALGIAQGGLKNDCRIIVLEVDSMDEFGRLEKFFVDAAFIEEFSLHPIDGVVKLKNRSGREKRLNDRLVIGKIFLEDSDGLSALRG
jgi:hypothetical protein